MLLTVQELYKLAAGPGLDGLPGAFQPGPSCGLKK